MLFNFTTGLTVNLSDSVEGQIRSFMQQANYQQESGGILIGRIEPLKSIITITNITYPQPNDKRLPFRFLRKQGGHQDIMDKIWEESGFEKMYLGEWHTHSTNTPTPSTTDTREWKRRANKRHNTPHILFLIVGKNEACLWTVYRGVVHKANEALR